MLVSELLIESFLFEKLGNLSQLKAGKLMPALMQQVQRYERTKKEKGDKRSIEDKNDINRYRNAVNRDKVARNIGTKSEIKDIGVIKSFAAIKKASNEEAGFGIYLDGQCVFLSIPSDSLTRSSAPYRAAWDPRAFGEVKPDLKYEKGRRGYSWAREEPGAKKEEDVVVNSVNPTTMKKMIDDLIEANPGKVTAKVITVDRERTKRAWGGQRIANADDVEEFSGSASLARRLAKYKLSKNPTASDIEEFFQMALGGKHNKIQYEGKSYLIKAGYASDHVNTNAQNAAIFKGKPFKIRYEEADIPGHHGSDSITITMKFFPETMTLGPISVQHGADYDETKKSKIYNQEEHLKDKLGYTGPLTQGAITAWLEKLAVKSYSAAESKLLMLRKAELPDIDVESIQKKVNRIVAKERLSALHDGSDDSIKSRLG